VLRQDAPAAVALFGIYRGAGGAGRRAVNVSVCLYSYGEGAEHRSIEAQRAWSAWLETRFPAA
jgi:hypothetical protein